VKWDPLFCGVPVDKFYSSLKSFPGNTSADITSCPKDEQHSWLLVRGLVAKLLASSILLSSAKQTAQQSAAGGNTRRSRGKGRNTTPNEKPKEDKTVDPHGELLHFSDLLQALSLEINVLFPHFQSDLLKGSLLETFNVRNWRIILQVLETTHKFQHLEQKTQGGCKDCEELFSDSCNDISVLNSMLKEMGSGIIEQFSDFNGKNLPAANVFISETVTWVCLLLEANLKVMPSKRSKANRAKMFAPLRDAWKESNTIILEFFSGLEDKLVALLEDNNFTSFETENLSAIFATMKGEQDGESDSQEEKLKEKITENIETSYKTSLENIIQTIATRRKFLQSLKNVL